MHWATMVVARSGCEVVRFRNGDFSTCEGRSRAVRGCIGNLKPRFLDWRYIPEPAKVPIVGAFSETRGFASVGSGGTALGNARSVADGAARSNSSKRHCGFIRGRLAYCVVILLAGAGTFQLFHLEPLHTLSIAD